MIPLKFAISSHIGSPPQYAGRLLKSLDVAGVDRDDILVVCGGSAEERSQIRDGIRFEYVTHNSYDHTAPVYLVESMSDHPYWWIMHDTTEAGPEFLKRIQERGATHSHITLMKEGWMNQGLFSMKFLQEIRHYVLGLKNCSKLRAILSERVYPRLTSSTYYEEAPVLMGKRDVYGDGDLRSTIHFPSIDFRKHQKHFIESQYTRSFLRSSEVAHRARNKSL